MEKKPESTRMRHELMAMHYRSAITPTEGAASLGVSRSTVTKCFRIFKLIDQGLADKEIADDVSDYSRGTIAGLRQALAGADVIADSDSPRTEFLKSHRHRLFTLAEQVRSQYSKGMYPWPDGWLGATWPRPWTGEAGSPPRLEYEPESEFRYLLEHLESLRLGDTIKQSRLAAVHTRDKALQVRESIANELRDALPETLLNAAILYGSQIAESPGMDPPKIEVAPNGGSHVLNLGAYQAKFDDQESASQAARAIRTTIRQVSRNSTVGVFYAAREGLRDLHEAITKLLKTAETIKLTIAESTCPICRSLVDSGDRRPPLKRSRPTAII